MIEGKRQITENHENSLERAGRREGLKRRKKYFIRPRIFLNMAIYHSSQICLKIISLCNVGIGLERLDGLLYGLLSNKTVEKFDVSNNIQIVTDHAFKFMFLSNANHALKEVRIADCMTTTLKSYWKTLLRVTKLLK